MAINIHGNLGAEEVFDVPFGKGLQGAAVGADHLIDEVFLLLLQLADFLLDAVFGDESVGEYGIPLADAVGAVDCLCFG